MVSGEWLVAAAFGTAGGTGGLIAALWQYRGKPGAGWFLASLTCQALWGLTYGVALLTFDPPLRRGLGVVGIGLFTGLGAYFLAFTLEYTGRGQVRGQPAGVLVAVLPVVMLAFAAANPVHGLLWRPQPGVVEVAGVSGLTYGFRPTMQVLGVLAATVVTVGSLLLFDTVFSYGPLYRREAVTVGLSPVPPMTALVLWLFEAGPATALNVAPFLFLVHIVLDAYAFVGSDMFEFHPATRRRGERAAIDDLGSPVVVVDDQGRIVRTNDAASRVLGVNGSRALAAPVSDYVDDDLDPQEGGEVTVSVDGTPRTYRVTATPLAVDAEHVGATLVWQDITESRRREQRLAVLNRVLRHNLRNDMTVVRGFTEAAADRVEDAETTDLLETALEKSDALLSLGRTARDIERTLEGDPARGPVDVVAVVTEVLEAVAPPGVVAFESDRDAIVVETDRQTLLTVLRAVVENAVVHGTRKRTLEEATPGTADGGQVATERRPVRVRVAESADGVTVTVADDGPGVPEDELAVVRAGEETALEHGSGLGLWLVRWGSERIGADVTFETDDAGTTVTVELTRAADPAPE